MILIFGLVSGSGWEVWRGCSVPDGFGEEVGEGEGVGEREGSASIFSLVNLVRGTWQMGSRCIGE